MIQAQELRIGNYVTHRHFPYDNFTIRSISKDRIHMINIVDKDGYGVDYNLSDLHPIPLSPDILIKAGFKRQIDNKNLFFLNEFRYNLNERSVTLLRSCDKAGESQHHSCGFPFITDNVKCPFLHQLQNLIFALTGLELTINL